ncbi:MAG: nitroreductase family protein [Spirochaetales bacterium]|nr:nitroreductase family protein [Spirochaetales bacterium]MBP7264369.1 nitroreductase family protein [Spirochaetia bacterium]
MDILKELRERRAYRALSPDELPDGAARRIVEAGTLAPSCYNNQPWRIVAAEGQSLEALKAALPEGNAWATRAPLIIGVAVREADDCRLDDGRDYALFDAGLCAMAMLIQATAEHLVAHPIAGYNPKKAKAALGLPSDHTLIALIVVARRGDPDGEDGKLLAEWQLKSERGERQRKALDEVAAFGRWPQGR